MGSRRKSEKKERELQKLMTVKKSSAERGQIQCAMQNKKRAILSIPSHIHGLWLQHRNLPFHQRRALGMYGNRLRHVVMMHIHCRNIRMHFSGHLVTRTKEDQVFDHNFRTENVEEVMNGISFLQAESTSALMLRD